MPSIPAGAKAPSDRKKTDAERIKKAREKYVDPIDDDSLLEGLPESVTPPHRLQVEQTNEVLELFLDFEEMLPKNDYSDESTEALVMEAARRGVTFEEPAPLTGNDDLTAEAALRGIPTEQSRPKLIKAIHEHDVREAVIGALTDDDTHIDTTDRETLRQIMSLAARVNTLFREKIATDSEAYSEWSAGKGHLVMFALLTRYASVLGN